MLLRCPNPTCGRYIDLRHLRESEECAKAAASLGGLYRLSKRKTVTRAGGRPRKSAKL